MDPIDFSPGILGDLASLAGSGASGASGQIRAPSNIVGNSFAPAHVGSGMYGQPQNPTAPLSAALLPLSTYAPATPLPGVREGIIPIPSLDDLARSPPFNMTDQQLAAIRARAEHQALTSGIASMAGGGAAELALPELGAPEWLATLIGAGLDFHDIWDVTKRLKSAPDDAVSEQLNDSMNQWSHAQSAPPPWRAIP